MDDAEILKENEILYGIVSQLNCVRTDILVMEDD